MSNYENNSRKAEEAGNVKRLGKSQVGRKRSGRVAARVGTRLGIVVVAAGILYFLRPMVHPMVYGVVYSPGGLLFALIVLGVGGYLWFSAPGAVRIGKTTQGKGSVFAGVVVGAMVLGLLFQAASSPFEQRTLARETMAGGGELAEFPQVNPENARVVPRAVADVQTRGSVSYRQFRLGSSDIARMEDGSLAWSYAIEPEEFRNTLFEHQRGVLMMDMTRMDNRTIEGTDEFEFRYGKGMVAWRSALWQLRKSGFWSRYYDDAVEFVHEGTPYIAYPKTGHEWHLLPIPHTTPTWDGVGLVHPDGTIEHLSPQEAQESEILAGQRLYPFHNTRARMESLSHREGIINQLPVVGAHEGHIEVARLPRELGNTQPFVVDLEPQRMTYITAMEPYGRDTRGLDEVWFADARTGTFEFYATEGQNLTGPERAVGIARSADSRTNWGENFVAVEPVPVTVAGELWWHIKVVPTDRTDITRNVFVNSESGEAVELHATEAVTAFLGAGDVADVEVEEAEREAAREAGEAVAAPEAPAPEEPAVRYEIVIRDEAGEELERIPMRAGHEASIVPAGPEAE